MRRLTQWVLWLFDAFEAAILSTVSVLGLAIYVVGSLYFLSQLNADMFQRFGAIGVAAAFVYYSKSLAHLSFLKTLISNNLSSLEKHDAQTFDVSQAKVVFEETSKRLDRKIMGFEREQLWFGLFGSMQWGFGDLFVCYVQSHGARACG